MAVPSMPLQGVFLYEVDGVMGVCLGLINTVEQGGRLCLSVLSCAVEGGEEGGDRAGISPILDNWSSALPNADRVRWCTVSPPIIVPMSRVLATQSLPEDHPLHPRNINQT